MTTEATLTLDQTEFADKFIHPELDLTDPIAVAYLDQFDDPEVQRERAEEALKVGAIAIQSARPSLDTTVVELKFAEVEGRVKDSGLKNRLTRW